MKRCIDVKGSNYGCVKQKNSSWAFIEPSTWNWTESTRGLHGWPGMLLFPPFPPTREWSHDRDIVLGHLFSGLFLDLLDQSCTHVFFFSFPFSVVLSSFIVRFSSPKGLCCVVGQQEQLFPTTPHFNGRCGGRWCYIADRSIIPHNPEHC
jgi:hypothetical protein